MIHKINLLKKLGLIKYDWTNGLNGEVYYSANKKNPLFWVIYALLWVIFLIPMILWGTCYGIFHMLIATHVDFIRLFSVTEKKKK